MSRYTIKYKKGDLDGLEVNTNDSRQLQKYRTNFNGTQFVKHGESISIVKANKLLDNWESCSLELYQKIGKDKNNLWIFEYEKSIDLERCRAINKTNNKRCMKPAKENSECCAIHRALEKRSLGLV